MGGRVCAGYLSASHGKSTSSVRVVLLNGGLRHSWALGTRHFHGPQVNPRQDFQVNISLFIITQHNVYAWIINKANTRTVLLLKVNHCKLQIADIVVGYGRLVAIVEVD